MNFDSTRIVVIKITFIHQVALAGESEGIFRSSSQAAICPPHVFTIHGGGLTLSLIVLMSSREDVNTKFFILFSLTGRRIESVLFQSKPNLRFYRSITMKGVTN